jgi:hypothetical protein
VTRPARWGVQLHYSTYGRELDDRIKKRLRRYPGEQAYWASRDHRYLTFDYVQLPAAKRARRALRRMRPRYGVWKIRIVEV